MQKLIFMLIICLAGVKASSSDIPSIEEFLTQFPNKNPFLYNRTSILDIPETRIIGGSIVPKDECLHQVAIFNCLELLWDSDQLLFYCPDDKIKFCGGSIISKHDILTAAHCVAGDFALIAILVGAHNLFDETEPGRQWIYVFNPLFVEPHEKFDYNSFRYDVAVINLVLPLEFNTYVQPISLPNNNLYMDLRSSRVSGWGQAFFLTGVEDHLRQVDLTNINNKVCGLFYLYLGGEFAGLPSFKTLVTEEHICTVGAGQGTCAGDSGGALFTEVTSTLPIVGLSIKKPVQVAIVSFGFTICSGVIPSVFTRTGFYYDWIKSKVIGKPLFVTVS